MIPGLFYIYREVSTHRETLCFSVDIKGSFWHQDKMQTMYIVAGDSPYAPPMETLQLLPVDRLHLTDEYPLTVYERMRGKFMESSRTFLDMGKISRNGVRYCMHNFDKYQEPVDLFSLIEKMEKFADEASFAALKWETCRSASREAERKLRELENELTRIPLMTVTHSLQQAITRGADVRELDGLYKEFRDLKLKKNRVREEIDIASDHLKNLLDTEDRARSGTKAYSEF